MNNEGKQLLFVVNKHAGTGYQSKVEGRIVDVCAQHDAECTVEFTQGRGHATELARDGVLKGFDAVVAVGGDGTINEVGQGLLHSGTPMGIIPRGSGNGLARHLGIPLGVSQAAEALFSQQLIGMDTFTVNGKLSMNVSGFGFDGLVANLFGKDGKRGLPAYARLSVQEYFSASESTVSVVIDGRPLTRQAFIVAVANSSQYGNNARIAPNASICDGILQLSILKKVPPYRVDFVMAFFAGLIENSSFCEILTGSRILLDFDHPVYYHVDGEGCGKAAHFDIAVQPASLQMMIPSRVLRKV